MSQIFRLSCILNDLYSICVTYLIHVWWLAISVITACAVQWIIVTLHNMNIHVVLEYLCCFVPMLEGAAACQLYYCYCYYICFHPIYANSRLILLLQPFLLA